MEVDEKAEGLASLQSERRRHPRYALDENSVLLFVKHALPLQSRILDLSLEGCRMRTVEQYSAGVGAHVELNFKVNGVPFRFSGITQWSDGKHLVGIRFDEMISRRREELAEVLAEMEAAAAAQAEKEALKVQAEEKEAQEWAERRKREAAAAAQAEKEAVKRLAEEKEAQEQAQRQKREAAAEERAREQTATAAQKATLEPQQEVLPPSEKAPDKRDRRGQVRHGVDTSATIFLIKVGSRLGGRILDLSLSGCRIRTDERFPVGIYTRVEVEFRLQGLPFRLGGVIQAIHDRHHVGIRFLDMSSRRREQVEQLIEEIREIHEERKPGEAAEAGLEGQS
jgi:flagellar biosynthesis GTPase FlhF